VEEEILPTVRELGIGFVAYSPLGRGFLTGAFDSPEELEESDFRRHQPRLQGENLDANRRIVARVRELAAERGATPAQIALAWVHSRGDDVVPIPGTKRRRWLEENAAAVEIDLQPDEIARLEEVGVAAGDRYTDMSSVNR
jgi:aryl-alcohol dehydrogenase-like predicted oxidoreductase